ncbi:hypothetical protein P7245_24605, partial [Vibrio parahaemolyticus]|nr:hypothetical protein [Vibrio parahaemolyticus]
YMLSAIVNKGLRANFGLFAEMGATPLIQSRNATSESNVSNSFSANSKSSIDSILIANYLL